MTELKDCRALGRRATAMPLGAPMSVSAIAWSRAPAPSAEQPAGDVDSTLAGDLGG